jgi:hypothetical protein
MKINYLKIAFDDKVKLFKQNCFYQASYNVCKIPELNGDSEIIELLKNDNIYVCTLPVFKIKDKAYSVDNNISIEMILNHIKEDKSFVLYSHDCVNDICYRGYFIDSKITVEDCFIDVIDKDYLKSLEPKEYEYSIEDRIKKENEILSDDTIDRMKEILNKVKTKNYDSRELERLMKSVPKGNPELYEKALKEYNDYIEKHDVKEGIDSKQYQQVIRLTDALSYIKEYNKSYEHIDFILEFNEELIKYDYQLKEELLYLKNSILFQEKIKFYEQHKQYLNDFDDLLKVYNKYECANDIEVIYNLVTAYNLEHNTTINGRLIIDTFFDLKLKLHYEAKMNNKSTINKFDFVNEIIKSMTSLTGSKFIKNSGNEAFSVEFNVQYCDKNKLIERVGLI